MSREVGGGHADIFRARQEDIARFEILNLVKPSGFRWTQATRIYFPICIIESCSVVADEVPGKGANWKKRDSPIYYDNDVEIFIGADNAYYEFEMNSFGTIYEAMVMWNDRYAELGFEKEPTLARDHKSAQAFNGVGYKTHPRGSRTIALGYDFPKLKSAVAVDGSVNNSKDRDRGWTAEIALP